MYTTYYGLREKPFSLLPDPEYLYLSKQHRMALDLLEYSMTNQVGFCVITGEIGAGKTTLIRRLLSSIDDRVTVGLLRNVGNDYSDLLRWILMAYNLDYSGKSKVELHQVFVDFMIRQYAQQHRTVLIIDEAQHMTPESLEEVRMLSNINADKDQVVQVILAGQKELRDTLRRPDLAQFAQRVVVDYHLGPLSVDDTRDYIHHRIQVAGGRAGLFEDDACADVHQFSGGIPRLINLLCDTAMVYGYAEGSRTITCKQVQDVVRERDRGDLLPTFRWIAAAAGNRQEKFEHGLTATTNRQAPHLSERRKDWAINSDKDATEQTVAFPTEPPLAISAQEPAGSIEERYSERPASVIDAPQISPIEFAEDSSDTRERATEMGDEPLPTYDNLSTGDIDTVASAGKTSGRPDNHDQIPDAVIDLSSASVNASDGRECAAAVRDNSEITRSPQIRTRRHAVRRPMLPVAIGLSILGLVGAVWLVVDSEHPSAPIVETAIKGAILPPANAIDSTQAPSHAPASDAATPVQATETARQPDLEQRERERQAQAIAARQAEEDAARREAALEQERQTRLAAQRAAEEEAKRVAEQAAAKAKRDAEALAAKKAADQAAAKRAAADKLENERRTKALAAKKAEESRREQQRKAQIMAEQAAEEQARRQAAAAALEQQRRAQAQAAQQEEAREAQPVEPETPAVARNKEDATASPTADAPPARDDLTAQSDDAGFSANPCKSLAARYLSTCK